MIDPLFKLIKNMNKERLKKLESVAFPIITGFLFEEIIEYQTDFGIISVTEIIISPDTSYLDIYVSCLKNKETLTKVLAKYAKPIQRKLNKQLAIRQLPRIRFRYDDKPEMAQIVGKSIQNITNEIG